MDPAAEAAGEEYESDVGEEYEAEAQAPPEPEEPFTVAREDWEAMQQFRNVTAPFIGALAQEIQQAQQQQAAYQQQQMAEQYQQPQQPAAQWDPFDENVAQQFVRAEAQQAAAMAAQQQIQQAFGPYQGVMEEMANQQGEAMANDVLDEISEQTGEEFNRDVAIMLAAPLIQGGTDAVQALRAAAYFAQRFETEVREAERARYSEEVQNLYGNREGYSYSQGAVEEGGQIPTGKGRYEEAVRRVLARRHPVNPVG